VLSLFVVTAGGLGVTLTSGVVSVQQPAVESVDSEWGDVTEETTEVRTDVTMNNPNVVGVPGVVDLQYAIAMNDVTVAEGTKRGVGFGTGSSTVSLSTHSDNGKIPAWWASHVNNGEERRWRSG
jgi:LEA14-like dessication related protein